MKVDGALRSLIQGVSQQQPSDRVPGQCTLQENMSSNPVQGLTRRPPTQFIKDLFTDSSAVQYYEFHMDGTNYIVCITPTQVYVFDTTGTQYTVDEISGAYSYLDGSKIAASTLTDTTYISNTNTKVAMKSTTASYIEGTSILFFLGVGYGRQYTATVTYTKSGTEYTISASWTAPNGGSATDVLQITTDNAATQLNTNLTAATNFTTDGFVITQQADHLYITNTSGYPFQVQTSDGNGNLDLVTINNFSTSLANIPKYAPEGYLITVKNNSNASAANIYLTFIANPDQNGNTPAQGAGFGDDGAWYECVAPDIDYELDETTMPHTLTLNSSTGHFEFAAGGWFGRQVGDTVSNENPSFVGNTINDISYFQGRLVFISGISVIMSRTNDALDFWLKTATDLLPSDPIDESSTAKNVSKLSAAVPFNRDLIVFADRAQFIFFGRTAVTPQNSALVLTTTFTSNMNVYPVAAGRNIFYAIQYGGFTGVREFYTDGFTDINDSRPITAHINKYMTGNAKYMASTTTFDMLIVQTDGVAANTIFVYEYLWEQTTKVQASWSTWIMPEDVDFVFFDESIIYFVMKNGNARSLQKIDMDTQNDPSSNYEACLDKKTYITGVNTSISDPWSIMPSDMSTVVLVQGAGCPNPGLRAEYTYSSGTFTLKKDMGGGTVLAGIRYKSRYQPTMPIVKDQDGVKINTGTLRIKEFIVNYNNSAVINADIRSIYTDTISVYWSGRVADDPQTTIGAAPINTGRFIIPFRENINNATLEINSDDETPFTVLTIEWLGTYYHRGQRVPQGGQH